MYICIGNETFIAHLAVTCVVSRVQFLVVVVVVMVVRAGEVDQRDVDALSVFDRHQPRTVGTAASRLHGDDAGEYSSVNRCAYEVTPAPTRHSVYCYHYNHAPRRQSAEHSVSIS